MPNSPSTSRDAAKPASPPQLLNPPPTPSIKHRPIVLGKYLLIDCPSGRNET